MSLFSWDGRSPWFEVDDLLVPVTLVPVTNIGIIGSRDDQEDCPDWIALLETLPDPCPPEVWPWVSGWLAVLPIGEHPAVLMVELNGPDPANPLEGPSVAVTASLGPDPYAISMPELALDESGLYRLRDRCSDPADYIMQFGSRSGWKIDSYLGLVALRHRLAGLPVAS